mmetsp:Transcript_7716/g.25306  ORF Transcript_7716/g.25306 Transcript_7716/m.25306 type:complete len:145 (+) Transcript_7716:483-917(+)
MEAVGPMIAWKTVGRMLKISVLERSALEPKLKRQESAWGMDKLRRPQELIASRNVNLLLLSEIRAELFKREASIIGKRWELEVRLEKLYAAEPADSGPRETTSKAAASMRDKYTDKIRARTGGHWANLERPAPVRMSSLSLTSG